MKLSSIETTPSPNCMKLNLDELISPKPLTLQSNDQAVDAPEVAKQLLAIAGIQSVFLAGDFITLTRKGHVDWQPILAEAARLLRVAEGADPNLDDTLTQLSSTPPAQGSGQAQNSTQDVRQVEVAIQVFRSIPVQVRAVAADGQQARVALPERFSQVLQRAIMATQADYVAERHWAPYQPQFGNPDEVAQGVAEEITALIDEEELAQIEKAAIAKDSGVDESNSKPSQQALLEELYQTDWKRRLKAIQQIKVNSETFSAVVAVLNDERNTIRRWAAAILGASAAPEAVEPLSAVVLSDRSPIVRRTAGDALSDLGDSRATETMVKALQDSSSLVRWRAARFLNELGDTSALPFLMQAAEHESEFDVRVEMTAAIDRIQGGEETQLPMWMRIAQRNDTQP